MDCKAIFFWFAANGQSDKGFCWHRKFAPKGLYALAPGLLYLYKIIKNVYKNWFQREHYETCSNGQIEKAFLLSSKFCPQCVVCSCPGLNTCGKTCIKSDFKEIVLKLAANGQSDKGFLLTSTFDPMGLSAPALGLYTYIKALKYIPAPGVKWAFTGPLVLWFKCKKLVINTTKCDLCLFLHKMCCKMVWKFCEI